MADVINSAFDALGVLPVADVLAAPELFEQAVQEQIEGEQSYQVLFRTYTTDDAVVRYRYEAAPEMDDEVQIVPEFGEIPVTDPLSDGEDQFKTIDKYGLAARISEEQNFRNERNAVQKEASALARAILTGNGKAALAALALAPIEEFPVLIPWDNPDADVREDFGLATDLVLGATDSNGRQFGYQPSIFWANPVTINRAKRNKTVAQDFLGDMASENPIFKKIGQNPLLGGYLQVVPDMTIPVGEAYIAVEQSVGYAAENGPATVSPFYEEGGQSGRGGPNMAWRSDYVHFRGLFVPAPKAIVKLTGLATP